MSEEIAIAQVETVDLYNDEKAAIDVQIATAKRFPREIRRATDNSIAVATMDKQTAETCNYSLPRGGVNVAGPSVHLARIIAQEWGNLRVESKVISITNNQVVSQAVCFDLEKNYAVKVEVRKKITNKEGKRFNDDMITVTGNAANAIAYRNAVFAVIPKSVTDKVYNAAKNMITGDLSSEEKLIKKRKAIIDGFKENYNVTEAQILEVLGLNSINQIKQDEIVNLIGLAQAIKDGDTTVAETFLTTKIAVADKKVQEAHDRLKEVMNKKESQNPPVQEGKLL